MTTLSKFKLIIFFAISIFMFNGCKKGKDGEPGKDGSSNVTSRNFSVAPWSSSSDRWYTQLSVPELTSDNINKAAVQVYIGTSINSWKAIPCTVVASTNYFWGFVTAIGLVEVQWDYNGIGIGSDPNNFYGATIQVKVVVIPPAMIKNNPNVNLKDYQEVSKAFNLKD